MSALLNDREVAVTIDSLNRMRGDLEASGGRAPNVVAALSKINSLMAPDVNGLLVVPVGGRRLLDTLAAAYGDAQPNSSQFDRREFARKALARIEQAS